MKKIQKYLDFCRRRQNKDEAFVFEKSMIYDDMTIHIHEIYMLNRFLMVPGSQNHQFDEFLSFYFGKIGNFERQIKNVENYLLTTCSKSVKKTANDAQN